MTSQNWHSHPPRLAESYDVIVVGSGAAGMAAALSAALRGLSVVVIEGTEYFGGTTAYSGGAVWIPNSGGDTSDSHSAAMAYLEALTGDHVDPGRRDAFLLAAPKMIEEFDRRTQWVRWVPAIIPDYQPEKPGGQVSSRALEAAILDGNLLGADLQVLRPPSPATDLRGLPVTSADFIKLSMIARNPAAWAAAARILARTLAARARRQRPLALGQALVARLRLALRDVDVPVVLSCRMLDLTTADGRVTGVRVAHDGAERNVRCRGGVILAAGGFSRNKAMREAHLPTPTSTDWTLVPDDGQDGDGIEAGLRIGAGVELMSHAWGMPAALVSRSGQLNVPMMLLGERALPGTVVVDRHGARFANEALSYAEFWDAMYAHPDRVPAWLIFDHRAKSRYSFLAVPPRMPFPRSWYRQGCVRKSRTLEGLATDLSIDPAALTATVRRFNDNIRLGRPDDFSRGGSAYDRFYGDATLDRPNLQPLDDAPYYAVQVVPGDLGTQGGLAVDKNGRVLSDDGCIIEGLYAAGNCSSGVMGKTYPGPGATISAAMVAGYLAAGHIAESLIS